MTPRQWITRPPGRGNERAAGITAAPALVALGFVVLLSLLISGDVGRGVTDTHLHSSGLVPAAHYNAIATVGNQAPQFSWSGKRVLNVPIDATDVRLFRDALGSDVRLRAWGLSSQRTGYTVDLSADCTSPSAASCAPPLEMELSLDGWFSYRADPTGDAASMVAGQGVLSAASSWLGALGADEGLTLEVSDVADATCGPTCSWIEARPVLRDSQPGPHAVRILVQGERVVRAEGDLTVLLGLPSDRELTVAELAGAVARFRDAWLELGVSGAYLSELRPNQTTPLLSGKLLAGAPAGAFRETAIEVAVAPVTSRTLVTVAPPLVITTWLPATPGSGSEPQAP